MFDVSNAAAGSTFILNGSSPAFAATAAMLTDGINDLIETPADMGAPVPAITGGSAGFFESYFGTIPGPDFVGDTIGSITLHFDSVDFSQTLYSPFPGFPPAPYTQAKVEDTISVFDTATAVPEPAMLWVCAITLLGIVYDRRRRTALR